MDQFDQGIIVIINEVLDMAYNAYYINNGCYKNVFKTYVAFFDKRFKENRVKDIP